MLGEGSGSLAEFHDVQFAMAASRAQMLVQVRTFITFE
jgi:hypothetical protein